MWGNTILNGSPQFVKTESKSQKFSEIQKFEMLDFLIDDIFVKFWDHTYRQTIGIPMGNKYAPLFADLFLFRYDSGFLSNLVKLKQIHTAKKNNLSFRFIDDLLSFNNSKINQ